MNWIAENFTSTAKAWNTLCDAVEERAEVYQIDLESSGITIPRHKEAPVKWDFDFIRMRKVIFRIFQVSYLPLWFNTWQKADTDYRGAWDDFVLNSEVFNKLGIDSHAFFRVSPGAVTPRHTVSQFIFNAAKIINDACIYPAPGYSNTPEYSGFMLDADLYIEGFDPVYHASGKQSTTGALSYNSSLPGYDLVSCTSHFLAEHNHPHGRSRARNQCWIYHNPGGIVNGGSAALDYASPVLEGSCRLRSIDAQVGHTDFDDPGKWVVKKISFDHTVNFEDNRATSNIDLSGFQDIVDKIWNIEVEDYVYRIKLENFNPEIFLTEDNFPDYPGKYKYYTGKTI